MKTLFALALFISSSFAHAALNCHDGWGRPGYIRGNLQGVYLNFEGWPASGLLTYNGENSRSYYYRQSVDLFAEVEKTVMSKGVGRIYYHFPNPDPDKMNEMVIFYCN